ncbi:ArsR/SmtB family transcription factor [Ferroacidibacillus organovorans]|uniref:HTH arsR-type domain-containing protein n=1 Tax=Ferroacidibacillus organovorans TaxID=1765683 RepID=A0A101XRA4_9BACL|nr:metalloregulator ArsR/SmtB family transcription factor [Ferroacidibacillus organovorans]KUO96105.1 hypothetical protein ATW55_01685 [Ferroacidibacillus organovorans]
MGDTLRTSHTSLDFDAAWKALADPIRRVLLETLNDNQHFCRVDGQTVNGICVQDLCALLALPQSTVSRHLAILRQAGLVFHQQRGVWHYYSCHTERISQLRVWLETFGKLPEARD